MTKKESRFWLYIIGAIVCYAIAYPICGIWGIIIEFLGLVFLILLVTELILFLFKREKEFKKKQKTDKKFRKK